jgi:hypothetical protein
LDPGGRDRAGVREHEQHQLVDLRVATASHDLHGRLEARQVRRRHDLRVEQSVDCVGQVTTDDELGETEDGDGDEEAGVGRGVARERQRHGSRQQHAVDGGQHEQWEPGDGRQERRRPDERRRVRREEPGALQ